MNRIVIVSIAMAVISLAPAARAEEEAPSPPAVDVSALEGRVAAIEEQNAETKATVAALSRLKISGYVQPRYTYQECVNNSPTKGCSYSAYWADTNNKAGPDKDNFYIRRGRLKAVYDADLAQFVLQIDAISSGVTLKEAYASVKLPYGLAIDAGQQLMPFGYDVGVRSSADLDLLERFRGAGVWLKGEYDVGVTVRATRGPLNFRGGVFNGNGSDTATGVGRDNDQLKDLIGRLGFDFGMLTGGVSGWYGKTRDYGQAPAKTYSRSRFGADAQLYLDLIPLGGTALKGEYIAGTTASGGGVSGGSSLGVVGHGWHATLTQNLGKALQVAGRYDTVVPDNHLSGAKYAVKEIDELDVALHYFVGGNYKFSVLYAHPWNGKTVGTKPATGEGTALLPAGDVNKTDQLVVQAQAKF